MSSGKIVVAGHYMSESLFVLCWTGGGGWSERFFPLLGGEGKPLVFIEIVRLG